MGCLRRPKWPLTLYSVLAAVVLSAAVSISPSGAQGQRPRPGLVPLPDKPALGTLGERINTNTIAIVSGNINAAWLTIAYDLSAVLDKGDDFRVLPVIGRGGKQNVRDVCSLIESGCSRNSSNGARPTTVGDSKSDE